MYTYIYIYKGAIREITTPPTHSLPHTLAFIFSDDISHLTFRFHYIFFFGCKLYIQCPKIDKVYSANILFYDQRKTICISDHQK